MTRQVGDGAAAASQAALAAAILDEEDRRLRGAAARDRTPVATDDAHLDRPLLAAAVGLRPPEELRLAASRARIRRLGTGRAHALSVAAAAVAAAGLTGPAHRATGLAGVLALVVGALAGLTGAVLVLRRAVRRDARPLLQRMASTAAVATLAAPLVAGLPDALGGLLLIAIIGVVAATAAHATAALVAAAESEGRAGLVVVGVATIGRLLAYGIGGGVVLGTALQDASPLRAVVIGVVPAGLTAAGALRAMAGAVPGDLAAASLDDHRAQAPSTGERVRAAAGGERAEGAVDDARAAGPALAVRHLDFSYGHVQVLFDVSLEVRSGEVLALLGTNGAGKSTLLRAVSGLSPIDRGSIHHRGVDITFADPGTRVRGGIVQLPGGKAVFPSLTVVENLVAGGYTHIWDKPRLSARIEEVVSLFPVLRERVHQPAGTLSGGEQQMLALAKALLLEPDVLCIDELSLGLAPVVVQELLAIVERLKAEGLTMVIVEQSLNVALALADRAVFMEKGRVRFDGPARELAERGDLARAVFLGGEGG